MAETSIVRGRVARFTRLDALGRPVYGPGNTAVTKGIIQVTYTPNSEEGEGISVLNFAGEQCIQAPAPCASITNWTVAIQFCAIDPCVILMMYPSWIPYYDDFGTIKGFQVVGSLTCDTGFALEVWGGVGSAGGSGIQCGPGATGGFRYLLTPRLVGSVPGEIVIANDATTFTFNGTTTNPVGWRRGPYLVDIVDGVPSTLREPMVDQSQLLDITTMVQPPAVTNGCVNLPRPIPEEASLIIDRDPANETGMCIRVIIDNHGYGPVTVNWGDGTEPEEYPDCSVATHCYDEEGTYTVCVADAQTPVINVCRDVVIPLEDDNPVLTVASDPDNNMCVIASVTMPTHSDGRVEVDWGDGTPVSNAVTEGDQPVELTHCYQSAGVYQIRATRVEQPVYYDTETVILPSQENPVISATVDGMDVTLTVDNHGNGLTTVDWGDGQSSSGPTTDGGTVEHTYDESGTYEITVVSIANPLARATTQVVIGDVDDLTGSVEADPADPTGFTAIVEWDNGTHGPVSIQWDDDAVIPDQPATGTDTKVYEPDETGLHTVTIQDEDDPARSLEIEFEIPLVPGDLTLRIEPDPSDPSGYTAVAIWGPGDGPEPPTDLQLTIEPAAGDATGYTAQATWTQGD